MHVSIVIPTLNEERNIGRCMESIVQAAGSGPAFEVICVDNGSTDRTLEIFRSYADRLTLDVVEAPGVHVSAMRNRGTERARAEIVAFIDADCTIEPGWIARVVTALDEPGVAATGCRYRIPDDAAWVARTWDVHMMDRRLGGETGSIPAGGLAVRKNDFTAVGGFDENLLSNEDWDLCHRLREAGKRVVSNPDLAVVHWGASRSIKQFFGRQRWHGAHVFKVFLKNFHELRNVKVVALGFVYAISILVFIAGVLALVAGRGSTVLLAAVLLLVIPALGMAAAKVASLGHSFSALPGLSLLYGIYGFARAISLLDPRNWFGR